MQFGSNIFDQGILRFYGIRILLCVLILLGYFFLVRPARIALTEYGVYPQVKSLQGSSGTTAVVWKDKAIQIEYTFEDKSKQLSYRPEFGFFFLVTLLALVFVTDKKSPYLQLTILHLGASIIAYFFLIAGVWGFKAGFIFVDAISAYLTPALSLALVPMVFANKM